MNLDANVQKILLALLRKWKLLVLFALIGAVAGYLYTANFTTLTYSSSVEFLIYAYDGNDDINSVSNITSETRSSNTSKMNYARGMMPTYMETLRLEDFRKMLVEDMNATYNANYTTATIGNTITIKTVESTAMFRMIVTTTDPDLSYKIAKQLEVTVLKAIKNTNSGLCRAEVVDSAVRATSAGSLGYAKKCTIAAVAAMVLAGAYVVLRTLLDVRIRSTDELTEKYSIPVLGSIPNFESRGLQTSKGEESYAKKE